VLPLEKLSEKKSAWDSPVRVVNSRARVIWIVNLGLMVVNRF
jgi:hypothetical protein